MTEIIDFKTLQKLAIPAREHWNNENFDKKLDRHFGQERLVDNDFSALDWATFEKLIAHLLIAQDKDIQVIPMPGPGAKQGGCDIVIFENDTEEIVAYEAKCNAKIFTSHDLARTTKRFLDRGWAHFTREFHIILAGEIDNNALQKFRKIKAEWRKEHQIDLIIQRYDFVWHLIYETPQVAFRILPEPDARRVAQAAGYKKIVQAGIEEQKRIQREASFYDMAQDLTASLTSNITKPEVKNDGRHFSWRNNVVRLSASLPTKEDMSCYCRIAINIPGSQDVTFSIGQTDILTLLWPGLNLPMESGLRGFLMSAEVQQEYIRVYFGGAGCSVPRPICQVLCDAVDAYVSEYIRSFHALEKYWGVERMKFNWHSNENLADIILCRVPSWLWECVVAFIKEHDCAMGDTDWHIFDAVNDLLKVYNHEPRAGLSAGYHCFLTPRADVSTFAWRDPGGYVDLLWTPPSVNFDKKMGDKDFWRADKAFDWFQNKLLPEVKKWLWSNRPLFNRMKLHLKGYTAENEFGPDIIEDYRDWYHIKCPSQWDAESLEYVARQLQSTYHSRTVERQVQVPPNMHEAVLNGLLTILRHYNPGKGPLGYMGGNIGIATDKYPDFLDALEALLEGIAGGKKRKGSIEMYLRSLIDALGHANVDLKSSDTQRIGESLEPLIEQYNEYHFVSQAPSPK